MVDYPRRARLEGLGRASVFDGDPAGLWLDRVKDSADQSIVERVHVIHVEAFEWNCQQHITPRFRAERLRTVWAPVEQQLLALEEENRKLRRQLAARSVEIYKTKHMENRVWMVEIADGDFCEKRVPIAGPGAGEVLVEVAASGVSVLDTKIRAGKAAHAQQPLPAVLGLEMAGTVVEVGPAGGVPPGR